MASRSFSDERKQGTLNSVKTGRPATGKKRFLRIDPSTRLFPHNKQSVQAKLVGFMKKHIRLVGDTLPGKNALDTVNIIGTRRATDRPGTSAECSTLETVGKPIKGFGNKQATTEIYTGTVLGTRKPGQSAAQSEPSTTMSRIKRPASVNLKFEKKELVTRKPFRVASPVFRITPGKGSHKILALKIDHSMSIE